MAHAPKSARTKRPKSGRKTATRKPAPRKQSAPRLDPQRAELLLAQLSGKIERAKSPREIKKLNKQLADALRARRQLGFTTSFASEDGPTDTPVMRRESMRERDEEDEDEGDDFIGPIGDTYDEDFGAIDWDEFDWSELLDDIGDVEEDSYSEAAK